MLAEVSAGNCNWLCTGDEIFPAMLEAIDSARESVRLETYIYSTGALGEQFRDALIRGRERGVRVEVLFDALGSQRLPNTFWEPLLRVGGQVRKFNPLLANRFGVRDHRKLLVCDEKAAFVGGFNIASEYQGDGVTCGWCDLGLKIEGPLVSQLARSFDDMFSRAEKPQPPFIRLHGLNARRAVSIPEQQLLMSGPGRGRSPIKGALRRDLERARKVQIVVAYFVPSWRLRRSLIRVARRGGHVQLILAGKSDVTLSRLAAQRLYRRFLKAGIEIFEYQPQILHAKLFIIDDVVYVGSANLDPRSLNINYELMIRFENARMADEARRIFEKTLTHSQPITSESWGKGRSFWRRLKTRWAYFLLVRMDPIIAGLQWQPGAD